jgi:hypothetical protein
MTTIYLPAFTKGFRLQESSGEDAENSLNTELGFRFDKGALHEVIGITTILESARF